MQTNSHYSGIARSAGTNASGLGVLPRSVTPAADTSRNDVENRLIKLIDAGEDLARYYPPSRLNLGRAA